ncbi:MAG: adenylate/guanylate cyclase domain-containing protein [Oligoflexus sp.]
MIFFSLVDMAKAYTGQSGTFVIHLGFSVFILSQAAAIAQVYTWIYRRLVEEELKRKHSFQQLGKVFYPHQLQMMAKGTQLEHTMPTGNAQACAISFDIIGSTKIKHADKFHIIKEFFSKCYEIMMEGYDPQKLTANAYRVKEMGDGFLCSIGYPFQVPIEDKNIATFSVELAYRFAELFEEHRKKLDYDRPIHFGIGLAMGDIYAFYPETGTKEYDVHGKAVILATRYEQMRKFLVKIKKDASFIIIQEDVYLSLPADIRRQFECLNLEEHMIAVRDDPDADRIYVSYLISSQSTNAA